MDPSSASSGPVVPPAPGLGEATPLPVTPPDERGDDPLQVAANDAWSQAKGKGIGKKGKVARAASATRYVEGVDSPVDVKALHGFMKADPKPIRIDTPKVDTPKDVKRKLVGSMVPAVASAQTLMLVTLTLLVSTFGSCGTIKFKLLITYTCLVSDAEAF